MTATHSIHQKYPPRMKHVCVCVCVFFGNDKEKVNQCNLLKANVSFIYLQKESIRVFANGPGDLGSIPGRVIPKTLKMELDTTLLNTQHYKVRFKGKVEQSREWSSALPYTLV